MTAKKSAAQLRPKTHIVHALNYSYEEAHNFEHPTGVSKTVPNQVLSPKEMLEKFTRGVPLNATSKEPIYSDMELPDFAAMDFVEIQEWREANQQEIKKMTEELEAAEEEIKKRDAKAALKKEIEDEQNQNPPTSPTPTPLID